MKDNKNSKSYIFRALTDEDIFEYADLLYGAFNAWWWKHGLGRDFYECEPRDNAIFYQIYNDLSPGCSIAAFHKETNRMMGACFYHPRTHHVSLGIMSVHPNYVGTGVARGMVDYILDFTKENGYKACRLVNSAMNLDSFSLYNRSGFIPREMYQDMILDVPDNGVNFDVPGVNRVRKATLQDVSGMGELEMEVCGVLREKDYEYAINNPRGVMNASVYTNDQNEIEGFLFSLKHPSINILGPCVARTEEMVIALIRKELENFYGIPSLFVVPMKKRKIVETFYTWGAKNVETHVMQVWGEYQEIHGVALPSYLPETG